MKLRVRIREPISKTVVLELNTDGNAPPKLEELHQKAIEALLGDKLSNSDASYISLNGADKLSEDDQKTLEELGVVHGDLVILVIKNSFLQELKPKNVQPANASKDQLPASMDTGVVNPGASIKDSASSSENVGDAASSSDAASSAAALEKMMEDERPPDAAEVNQYLRKTMLITDSRGEDDIPDSLRKELGRHDIKTAHDVLVMILHVLMNETGFSVCPSAFDNNSWKSSGFYKIQYSYPSLQHVTFELLGVPMAGMIVVYGSAKTNDYEKKQLKLKVADYTKLTDEGPRFFNLPKLSREFKDSISYSLVQMYAKDSEFAIPSLPNLFLELKMLILQKLDAKSLLELSQTSKGFNHLCKSPSLWYRLYVKRWGKHRVEGADLSKDWHKLYKERYRVYIATRQAMLRARVVVPPYINPPYPPMARPPPWVPPLGIGGDYDRDPGFPVNPFGGGRIDPMRPRFDPINPLQPRFDPFRPAPEMFDESPSGRPSSGRHYGVPRPTFGGGGGLHRFF